MMEWLWSILTGPKFRGYLARLNDPSKPDSLRHAAYMVLVAASIIWLSIDMAIKEAGGGHRGIDGNWVTAFGLLLAAVTGGKVLGGRNGQDGSAARAQDETSGSGA